MDFANVPCTALQTVEFGENVMLIAEGAFKNGSAIHTVISRSAIPPTAINAFSDETYHNGVLYVPNDCIGAYEKAPGWKNFHEIQAIASDVSDGVVDVNGDNGNDHISIVDGAICISVDDNVSVAAASGTIIYSGHGEACINVEPGIYIVMIGHKASKVVVH